MLKDPKDPMIAGTSLMMRPEASADAYTQHEVLCDVKEIELMFS